jgi:invasion protein IalB
VLKITQNQNNVQRVVFTWLIGVQDGKAISMISVPPGIMIDPGVAVKIGAIEVSKYSYALCQPDYCVAIVPLDDAIVKQLTTAPTAEVSVVAVNGSTVKFTVNLYGFGQALAELTK